MIKGLYVQRLPFPTHSALSHLSKNAKFGYVVKVDARLGLKLLEKMRTGDVKFCQNIRGHQKIKCCILQSFQG